MSYHIVHITNPSKIRVEHGFLICQPENGSEHRVPFRDILIIVSLAAVSFTGNALAALLENNCLILHCNRQYQPIGKSIPLHHIIHKDIFDKQIHMSETTAQLLWERLLRIKTENQKNLLEKFGISNDLGKYLENTRIDEANAARHYWKKLFGLCGTQRPQKREYQNAQAEVNKMLNYGYAVFGSIIHRSILAHGLLPQIGIHHQYRFKTDPLVYDLVEPLRAFCDYGLLDHIRFENYRATMQTWIKHVAQMLTSTKVKLISDKQFALIDAIDIYVSSVADFIVNPKTNLHIPSFSGLCL